MESPAAGEGAEGAAVPAAESPPKKPKRKTEWVRILLFLAVVGAVGWFGRRQLALGYQIKMIGDENFGQSVGESPVPLNVFADRALSDFEARELAWFLQAPIASWRVVACQGIEKCKWTKDSPEWQGVVEKLARVATSDSERLARVAASSTLLSLPGVSEADGQKILEIGQRPGAREGRSAVLRLVAKHLPDQKAKVEAVLLKMGDEGTQEERHAALASWTEEFNDKPEPAIRWLLELAKNDAELPNLIRPAQAVVRRNREKAVEMISAGRHGAVAVVLGGYTGQGRPLVVKNPERLEEASLSLLSNPNEAVAKGALRCLLGVVPNGWNAFVNHVSKAAEAEQKRLKATVMQFELAPNDVFTFGKAEGDLVATWLDGNADDPENLGFQLFRRGFATQKNVELFAPGSGTSNPANAKHLEPYLVSANVNERWLAAQFFSYNPTLTESKLPQIEKVVRDEIAQPLKWEERDESLARARRLLEKVLKRFPARAELKALLADVAKGEEVRKEGAAAAGAPTGESAGRVLIQRTHLESRGPGRDGVRVLAEASMHDKKLRSRIADEAARLLLLRSESEYSRAKRKAARSIGVRFEPRDLPSNREVQRRLERLHQAVDAGPLFPSLRAVELEALRWMRRFAPFQPLLTAAPSADSPPDGLFTLSLVAGSIDDVLTELQRIRVDYQVDVSGSGPTVVAVRDVHPFRIVVSDQDAARSGQNLVEVEAELASTSPIRDVESELLGLEQPADRFDDLQLLLRQLEQVPLEEGDAGDLLHHSLQVFELAACERPFDEELLTAALVHEVAREEESWDAPVFDLLDGVVTHRTRALVESMVREDAPAANSLAPNDLRDVLLLRQWDVLGRSAGAATRSLEAAIEHLRSLDRGEF